jgi:hypothetical protein
MPKLRLPSAAVILDYTEDGWVEFVKWIDGTQAKLPWLYTDLGEAYDIVAVDTNVCRTFSINKVDAADFEARFRDLPQTPTLGPANLEDRVPLVAPAPREGDEVIYATHNLCDETTWYGQSIRITDEVLTDSGDGLTFTSVHSKWIDMVSGKVFDQEGVQDDERILDPTHHGWVVVVNVDGVEQTMREALEASGGDYTVDYVNGSVVFFVSQAGKTVTASYSYANGSRWTLKPSLGRALDMETAEAQFSLDASMTDTLRFEVFGYVQIFAPQLWDGYNPPGPYPINTLIPLQSERYLRLHTIIDNAFGSYPVIPAMGAVPRGMSQPIYGFPFRYSTLRRLWSKYGMELRISLEHDRVFTGERVTATFYCVSRDKVSI